MKTLKGILYLILITIITPVLILGVLLVTYSEAALPKTNEIIVKYKNAAFTDVLFHQASMTSDAFVIRMHARKNLKLKKEFSAFQMYGFEVSENENMEDLISELYKDPNIEFAEPNYEVQATRYAVSTVDFKPKTSLAVPGTEDLTEYANPAILVAVVDTGVDYTHTALKSKMYTHKNEIPGDGIDNDKNGFIDDVMGWDFAANTPDAYDDNGHGTHVAGIIAGVSEYSQNKSGNYKIIPLKFLDADGYGTTMGAISAIEYGLRVGVKVFNNSWGGGGFSLALHDVVTQTYQAGALFVAAAGNSSQDIDEEPAYPASYEHPNVLTVAAVDAFGSLAWFSNFGKKGVDVAAPGVNIYSSLPENKYGSLSGTSMATPYVTRMATLMMDENRGLSAFQVKDIIMQTVKKNTELKETSASEGAVDGEEALKVASETAGNDSVPPYNNGAVLNEFLDENGSEKVDATPKGCAFVDDGNPPTDFMTLFSSLLSFLMLYVLIFGPIKLCVRRR